jgi:hypothetical protein
MTRYFHHMRFPALAGLVLAAATLAISAGPAAAAVCPPGITNPAYCTNTPPTAVTGPDHNVGPTTATLTGTVNGFGVDTRYFFQYGKTSAYGRRTPTQLFTGCPPGVTNPQYCVCPPGVSNPAYCIAPSGPNVSAVLTNLSPKTKYHYRLVALNDNGRTNGADRIVTTANIDPIRSWSAPGKVQHTKTFVLTVRLRTRSALKITLTFGGDSVREFFYASRNGVVHQTIKAPRTPLGKYFIHIGAKAGGSSQKVSQPITVF